MFCNNCGFNLNGDEKFCTRCGAKIESKIIKTEEKQVEPITEGVVESVWNEIKSEDIVESVSAAEELSKDIVQPIQDNIEQPAVVQETVVEVKEEQLTPAPKKKGKKTLWLGFGIAAIIIAVLATFVAFNFSYAKNLFKKTFSSDEEYFRYVHEEQIDNMSKELATFLSNVKMGYDQASASNIRSTDGKITMKLDTPAIRYLKDFVPFDISWLNGADVAIDMIVEGSAMSAMEMKADVNLNGKHVGTLEVIIDYSTGKVFVRVPEINEEYIYAYINADNGNGSDFGYNEQFNTDSLLPPGTAVDQLSMNDYIEIIEGDGSFAVANGASNITFTYFFNNLPEQEELEKLISKYIKLIIDNIEKVEKENETVEVNEISTKCTKYEVDFDEDQIKKIYTTVLKELKNDQVIGDFIKGISNDQLMDDRLYEECMDDIDRLLDELEDMEDIEGFEYTVWVDSNGKVVACEIGEDSFEIEFGSIQKGEKYGSEFKIGDKQFNFAMYNGGTIVNGVKNGEFVLKVNGDSVLKIETADFDTQKYEEGKMSGCFTISLGSVVRTAMMVDDKIKPLADLKLVVDFNDKENDDSFGMDILVGSTKWASIEMTASETDETVDIPSSGVWTGDDKNGQKWAQNANFEKIFTNLRDAGMPEYLIIQLRMALLGNALGSTGNTNIYN